MFSKLSGNDVSSTLAIKGFVLSVSMSVVFSILDGWLAWDTQTRMEPHIYAFQTWIRDFRFLCDQGVYTSAVFWIGSKFMETRTTLTVGFDTRDAQNLSVKGPDDANTVWIGRTYKARLEAEAVVAAIEERLQQTATV